MTETETGLGERLSNRFEDFGRLRYRFRQNPMSLVGLGIILGLIFLAILAPWVAPYPNDAAYQGEAAVHFDQRFESPSLSHPFGTDQAGRDIFSRVLFGTRLSLQIGLVVLAVAVSIGVTVGLVGGYVGGAVGMFLMRVTDVFLSVPPLVLALGVSVALEPSLTNSMLAIAAVWWPWYARLTYGEVLSVKKETFVEASRGIGASTPRTIFREILPNVLAPITVKISLDMGYAILVASALGFLGLGAQPPTPEWGTMVSQGRNYLPAQWWFSTFPGLAIFLTVLGFNFLGDGLRDMFDVEVQ
ncbi:ABC transporter permease (plasmid) [Haloferax mediterranei ATCC 33500]|uniref:ABC transporter permease n=1 Tax=Haloferax mediterranei (strain ATCC 33500 / DSM 1411 / JCM 8866 / NBRC 14739 / NCIMB 2177 / R-4) TaxID=523841 RepID=I3R9W9_HALMT|nr:ABC transporter permease [Haloferax mediterranei]AFK21029.1 oligopeptide transport system permease protein OppC [Haloferax mediterranei ATCC 33500]AHZ24110.1 D-ala-D-ala transporter subunit [Haloferax mediterranei ATCC 33500]EMA05185.1 oligopeptide transport system permease OppC [Haloferax mediterranei ATCC 33500]MDX5990007.1 ABC transporter permease [Haloferax mediterranei ATCC 33500]QCQ77190.1 ABC transporter permease [Haloferax mediterranei ATCC 33500]